MLTSVRSPTTPSLMRRKTSKTARSLPPPSSFRLQFLIDAPAGHVLAIAALVAIAYLPSFRGVFVMDDYAGIVDNRLIRQVFPLGRFLDSSQPLVDVTLALNYAAGALNPWGYHFVNLIIHLLTALTLYGVVRRTTAIGGDQQPVKAGHGLALIIATIWAVHPLQTESVTYVIQRSEAMMGLFYLLTLYCVIRGMQATRPARWYIAAVIACAAGMVSKAVMVTAPILVLLYDRCFSAGPFAIVLRRRWGLYLGLAMTWLVLFALGVVRGVMDTPQAEPPTVGFGYKGVTPLEYLQTQPGVILHYLALSFWPRGLCLDCGWPVARTTLQVVGPSAIIGALIIVSCWAFWRRKAAGFLGLAFFLILLPTSSFIPIKDLAFEHRMYLPLAAVVALAVMGMKWLVLHQCKRRKPAIAISTIIVVVLAVSTWTRNQLYADPVALWRDAIAKATDHPRPHNALGYALMSRGDIAGAMLEFEGALKLDPQNAGAYANMGEAYVRQQRYADAVKAFQTALGINPNGLGASVHFYYGAALLELRRLDEAIEEFTATISLDPQRADAYYYLATALRLAGRRESAAAVFQQALGVNPRYVEAMVDLGLTLAELGRQKEAVSVYRSAISRAPAEKRNVLIKANYNLGIALRELKRPNEAAAAFRTALSLDPNHERAKAELETLLKTPR